MMNADQRAHLPMLLVIVALAAILRAGVAAPEACINRDGVWFVEMAKKLDDAPVRHMQIETKQPGYSWALLAAHRFVGDDTPEGWQATGTLLAGIGGVALCALVYFLALRLFDRKIAAVAGIFAVFWPQSVQLSAVVLSDMPHLAIYLGAMALVAGGLERRALLRWPIAGLLIGVAYWVRLEAIGFLPAVVIWTFVTMPKGRRMRAIAPLVLFLLAFGVVAGPFVAMARWPGARPASGAPLLSNSESEGVTDVAQGNMLPVGSVAPSGLEPLPCQSAQSACGGAPRLGSEARGGSYDCDKTIDSASALPAACMAVGLQLANPVAPVKLPGRMAEEWARSGRYVFAALFLAALFIRSTPRARRPFAWMCALVAVFQLLLVAARVLKYGELSSRYMLVPIALTIPWAAAGFVHLVGLAIERSSETSRYKFIPIWATGLMLALFPMIYYAVKPINAGRLTLREAGTWLRREAKQDDVILADDLNLAQVQYYADRCYPHMQHWAELKRDAGAAVRDEAIARIRPAWFVTMIDKPSEVVDAQAEASSLCERFPGYVVGRVFDDDARPVIVLRRGS